MEDLTQDQFDQAAEDESTELQNAVVNAQMEYLKGRVVQLRARVNQLEAELEDCRTRPDETQADVTPEKVVSS